jgi:hypothetical protein
MSGWVNRARLRLGEGLPVYSDKQASQGPSACLKGAKTMCGTPRQICTKRTELLSLPTSARSWLLANCNIDGDKMLFAGRRAEWRIEQKGTVNKTLGKSSTVSALLTAFFNASSIAAL